eukprot:CAMPEP_0181028534 /NCGR_PEP_ID=MMETSP1070-20121207/4719_1 /TAXON_ID=265543 /ORGANISM="Minutocellus polymorphus, Strain NH13" /LENGTH=753 /DNA_ID=CAMNT_0023105789 /DNA_START=187 /DNA_END=2448 /DNA_ORIENTATION=+
MAGRAKKTIQYLFSPNDDPNRAVCPNEGCNFSLPYKNNCVNATNAAKHIVLQCPKASDGQRYDIANDHRGSEAIADAIALNKIPYKDPNFIAGVAAVASGAATVSPSPPSKKQRKFLQGSMMSHATTSREMGPALRDNLALNLMAFMAYHALPFTVADSPRLKKYVQMLLPGYTPPGDFTMREKFLPKLFNSTVSGVQDVWDACSLEYPFRTLAGDGVKTAGGDVFNMTEASGNLVVFVRLKRTPNTTLDGEWYANTIEAEMKHRANAAKVEIHMIFCAIALDNVSVNLRAFRILQQRHPWIIAVGCRAHLFDLVIEDVFKRIDEFQAILDEVRAAVRFIKDHSRVNKLWTTILNGGRTVVLFPETRFAYGDLMLERFFNNRSALYDLINHDDWADTTRSTNRNLTSNFEDTVNNPALFTKIKGLREITSVLSAIIHFVESPSFSASWTLPLFLSLGRLLEDWIRRDRNFSSEAKTELKNTYLRRWNGSGNFVGVFNPSLVVASVLDPNIHCLGFFSKLPLGLPTIQYDSIMRSELGRFCSTLFFSDPDESYNAATHEFKALLLAGLSRTKWAKLLESYKARIMPFIQEATGVANALSLKPLDLIGLMKKHFSLYQAKMDWMLMGRDEEHGVGALAVIAMRYLCIQAQTADVERANKANKVIHTKARFSLKETTTHVLLYCYHNLRLLEKYEENGARAFSSATFVSANHEEESDDDDGDDDNSVVSVMDETATETTEEADDAEVSTDTNEEEA